MTAPPDPPQSPRLMPRPVADRAAAGHSVAVDRQVPGRAAAARIRAMITFWQQGGKHWAEVGKRAGIYADAKMCI